MPEALAPEEVISLLALEPNATCGSVRVTFVSPLSVAPKGLPPRLADSVRPVASAGGPR